MILAAEDLAAAEVLKTLLTVMSAQADMQLQH
jgi:hypothetical protein